MNYKRMKLEKNTVIKFMAILLLSLLIFTLVCNDYSLYKSPIVKITNVEENFLYSTSGNLNATENYYKQTITGIVKNGLYKEQTVTMENTYGESLVYDDKYKVGTSVFIDNIQDEGTSLVAIIINVKRDHYIALIMLVLLNLLIFIGGKQGLYTSICLLLNILLFVAMLVLNDYGLNIFALSIIMSVLFCCITLLLINGINKITAMALVATLLSISFTTVLSSIVMHFSPMIDYEFMEYLAQPYEQHHADLIFLSEILIGGVGVIIDISVTLTSCVNALLKQNPNITTQSLIKSCRAVSDDISGTMINVVFFTNISSCIPLFVISLQNEIGFTTVVRYNIFFEICRFLTGSIGIISAIPFSILAVYLFYRRKTHQC